MEAVFLKLLNMSLTACLMILAVLPVRALLKKAPRWSICLLWGLVALRLICPFSLESSLSLITDSEPVSQTHFEVDIPDDEKLPYPEHILVQQARPLPNIQVDMLEQSDKTADPVSILAICSYVWLAGACGMVIYAFLSFLLLKRRVATATRLEANIRQSEFVTSPFVLGLFRPTIYLPYGLTQPHLNHILAHERSHIRRGDHLVKPFAFLVLSAHWFNPLVWVAYFLLCRDIESACDERVICEMTYEQRQSYSATLLRCSVHRRSIAACPVAFGEVGVKQRIKGILNYRQPTLWIILAVLIFAIVAGICFLTDRPEEPQLLETTPATAPTDPTREARDRMDELLDILIDRDPEIASNPRSCIMLNKEVYEELLSYDELALDYFIPKLRKADVHSYREFMMAYTCAELTGVGVGGWGNSSWWQNPQQWIAEYDRSVSPANSEERLTPGVYDSWMVWYDNSFDAQKYIGDRAEQCDYYVTADSFVRACYRGSASYSSYHSDYDTLQEKVEWQWESPDGVGAPQTQWATEVDAVLDKSLTRLDDSKWPLPDFSGHRLYQPLEDNRCLMLCNDDLYIIEGDFGIQSFSYLHYVAKLDRTWDWVVFETSN